MEYLYKTMEIQEDSELKNLINQSLSIIRSIREALPQKENLKDDDKDYSLAESKMAE